MTEEQVRAVGPAFARYLGGLERFFDARSVEHLRTYCRGLLTDLPRKSVEPIALASGTAVRTLQEFLRDYVWDRGGVRDELHRRAAAHLGTIRDALGTVGIVDETSQRKKGTKTPGVQRQYLGCVGKTENGVVTVHVAVARGRFQALLDADLYLPQSWDQDRDRCRAADVPEDVTYRPKWQIALDQVRRAQGNGVVFDWLTFDEGYGDKPGFLAGLEGAGVVYVGEVPRDFPTAEGPAEQLASGPAAAARRWRAVTVPHRTEPDAVWEAQGLRVRLRREHRATAGEYWLIVARNRATGEVKYFASNAGAAVPLRRLLRVAFARWNVEHGFRLATSEAGLTHYEGRSYVGLMRHVTLCLVVMGFVAAHADGLRGEKPGGDHRAGVPGAERPVRRVARPAPRDPNDQAHGRGHSVSPVTKQSGS